MEKSGDMTQDGGAGHCSHSDYAGFTLARAR